MAWSRARALAGGVPGPGRRWEGVCKVVNMSKDDGRTSRLDRLRAELDLFKGREERARLRLDQHPPGAWRFALVGANVDPPTGVVVGEYGQIVPVEEPPGEVALASALKTKEPFGAIGRYMSSVTHELELDAEVDDPQFALNPR